MRSDSLSLFALVLAAGQSQRFGGLKQLATIGKQTLVQRAVREAEAVCGEHTILVVGNAAEAVHAAAAPLAGFLICNDRYREGIASSISTAVAAVKDVADGVLLTLADQPLVDRNHLARLRQQWSLQPQRIVASRYAGIAGVPAIIPAGQFAGLLALRGDQGARALISTQAENVITVDCANAAIDIDKPSDLINLDGGDYR
ncbi:MAG: nucleotidyltransferase family protein [Woeseia sp.]